MYYDDMSTGITVGDNTPFIFTSEHYQQNEYTNIDVEYVTELNIGETSQQDLIMYILN